MKKDNEIVEKIIVERKYTNEISAVNAIFPLVLEQLQREQELFSIIQMNFIENTPN